MHQLLWVSGRNCYGLVAEGPASHTPDASIRESMVLDSQIRVTQQSPQELLAFDPPYHLFGASFIFFGVFVLAVVQLVRFRTRSWQRSYASAYVVSVLFSLIGAGALTGSSTIFLSLQTGQLTVSKSVFGISFPGDPTRLSAIKEAKVDSMKNLRRVVLIMTSGEIVPLTSATDRGGYYELADAINDFLNH